MKPERPVREGEQTGRWPAGLPKIFPQNKIPAGDIAQIVLQEKQLQS